jgi:dUTP pyrophosphatase
MAEAWSGMENQSVTVQVERLASARDLPLPEKATALCAGMDLRAAVDHELRIEPGTAASIPTGIKIAVPPGYEAQVRPRSGLALKYRILVPNSPGTIDADYRGEVAVILFNGGTETFVIRRGDRIAQMVVQALPAVELEEVESLDGTERGAGGFGSTGLE